MEEIIVATTNNNKVKRIKRLLKNLDYKVLSLEDMGLKNIPEPPENASTPIDIAIEKAIYYSNYLPENKIILSQDETILLEGIKEEDDPKMHIKKPVINKYGSFTDEFAAEYYKDLANKYGGIIPMKFKYGIAVVKKEKNNNKISKKVFAKEALLSVRLTNQIHKLEKSPGYFFEALIEANVNNNWLRYNDLSEEILTDLDNDLYIAIIMLLKQCDKILGEQ